MYWFKFLNLIPGKENEQKLNNNKIQLRRALKGNPTLTKEIRAVLEQSLVEKLETLGISAVRPFILGIFAGFVLFCFLSEKDQRGEVMSVCLQLGTRG